MSLSIEFPYTTESNYTFDNTKIELDAGKAKLKLQQDDVDFTEDFADDTDFTYDSDLAEFTGGLVRQKDQRPANATFGASYTNNINGNWGNGILTGTAYNGAGVSNGKLDLTGGGVKYVDYDAAENYQAIMEGLKEAYVIGRLIDILEKENTSNPENH